ncbi:MAG: hypothetical protein M1831_004010 [Alyxoria varia]|nr:MAG: hypothetical protein M1831_004010 [Alyxoria varia]
MSKTPNPLEHTFLTARPESSSPSRVPVSMKQLVIAGIVVNVFGLAELPSNTGYGHQNIEVSCVWLLHPRLLDQSSMEPLARELISAWNNKNNSPATATGVSGEQTGSENLNSNHPSPKSDKRMGLIALSLDHRNHGSRLQSARANAAWRDGNPTHALDMLSGIVGTAADLSTLIDFLPAYLNGEPGVSLSTTRPPPSVNIEPAHHSVVGISLGAHTAWHAILHEPRITSAVILLGCGDYETLMKERARLSKRESWTRTEPPGAGFAGSEDYPWGLAEVVRDRDPRGFLMGDTAAGSGVAAGGTTGASVAGNERVERMRRTLAGKRIFNLAGGSDKLVPYANGEEFLRWLKDTVRKNEELNVEVVDKVYEGIKHEVSKEMKEEVVRFLLGEDVKEGAVSTPTRGYDEDTSGAKI